MGEAFALAAECLAADQAHLSALNSVMVAALTVHEGVTIQGESRTRVPNCLNVWVHGVQAETLLASVPELALSQGSACHSAEAVPSPVLLAHGLSPEQIKCCFLKFRALYDDGHEAGRYVV